MPVTIEELVSAGFPKENFPTDLPEPGPSNISLTDMGNKKELYRYSANVGGQDYAMEVIVDRNSIDDAAEGVGFMLNQFAYLWRMDKPKIVVQPNGACRRIEF